MRRSFGLLLCALLASSCRLFDGSVPCDVDEDCEDGVCVDGFCAPREAGGDGGAKDTTKGDGGPSDVGPDDPPPPDAGPPPRDLERGASCDPGDVIARCQPGLVCTPYGECQETCDESHCDTNMGCYSTYPDWVCPDETYSHCVGAGGSLRLCRDVGVDFSTELCGGGPDYVWFYHSDQSFPEGDCYGGPLRFVGSKICLGGTTNSSLTTVGGDLSVYTDDPSGFTDETACDYLHFVTLEALRTVGGDIRVGEVSGYVARTDLKVPFERLALPALHVVYGGVRFESALSLTELNYEDLAYVGGFLVLDELPALHTVYLPQLREIRGALRISDVPALVDLRLDSLEVIDGYVNISNAPCIDPEVVQRIEAVATGEVYINNDVATGTGCAP